MPIRTLLDTRKRAFNCYYLLLILSMMGAIIGSYVAHMRTVYDTINPDTHTHTKNQGPKNTHRPFARSWAAWVFVGRRENACIKSNLSTDIDLSYFMLRWEITDVVALPKLPLSMRIISLYRYVQIILYDFMASSQISSSSQIRVPRIGESLQWLAKWSEKNSYTTSRPKLTKGCQ